MDLNEISVFIQVIQAGSFSRAAKKLGMPNSTVSSKITSLERRLGVTLIQRTTRNLKITSAGEAFFNKCLIGMECIQDAKREITAIQAKPQGLLTISAPVELGSLVLPVLINSYIAKYPNVKIKLHLSDVITDLISDKVDVALRIGKLEDSTQIARKVGEIRYGLFSTAKYLKQSRARILHPRDLHKHLCLVFNPIGNESGKIEWRFENKKEVSKVQVSKHVELNNLNALKSLLLLGDGIAYFPTFLLNNDLKEKKVIRLLPEWSSKPKPVHLVYPSQKFPSSILSDFLNMAQEMIKV